MKSTALRLWPLVLALGAGCQVPPLEQVADGKSCDEGAGHACAPGYLCCRGACVTPDEGCCQPEDNDTFCARLGKTCDPIAADDNCGAPRNVNCGTCTGTASCQGNTCVCTPEAPAQLCARLGVQCEDATGADNCGTVRTVTCPACTAPNACGGAGSAGQCGCIAVGNMGCSAAGTVCCDGFCNAGKCCRTLGDPCTGVAGECCQGVCDLSGSGTCCRMSGFCSDDSQCCSGNCDRVSTNQCTNP